MNHPDFETRYIEWGSAEFSKVYPRYKRATGKTIEVVPTFWVEGTPQTTTYAQLGAAGLAIEAEGIIGWVLKTITQFLFGRIKNRIERRRGGDSEVPKDLGENTPLPTPPDGESPKPFKRDVDPEFQSDWLGVHIIILVKKKLDGLKGVVVGKAINLASGPIKRSIKGVTDGRADMEIVTQRENPNRFDRIARAAGIDPNPAEVVVLVPKFVTGLVKGLVTKKIVGAVSDRLPDIKVDVIFERTNGKDFDAVEAAVDSRETERLQGDPVKPKTQRRNEPVKPSIESLKAKDERETWLQWAMASLLTLLSAGNIWDRFKKPKPTTGT